MKAPKKLARCKVVVFRVQAEDGRGPWRPGLSLHWIDADSDRLLQADVLRAFGFDWRREIPYGWHAGCACRTYTEMLKWFTDVERVRLHGLGYSPVALLADKIIRENEDQVIFIRRKPLNVCVTPLAWDLLHGEGAINREAEAA